MKIDHEGRWVDYESRSGQDDTAAIVCSCGWSSSRIWSRLSIRAIQDQWASHERVNP